MNKYLILIAFLMVGCGMSGMMREPIISQCKSKGLKGCDKFADGAISYADGSKKKGMKLIQDGAAENSPEQVEPFLKIVSELLGEEIKLSDNITETSKSSAPVVLSDHSIISNMSVDSIPCKIKGQSKFCHIAGNGSFIITSVEFKFKSCNNAKIISANVGQFVYADERNIVDYDWEVSKDQENMSLNVPSGNFLLLYSDDSLCSIKWSKKEPESNYSMH